MIDWGTGMARPPIDHTPPHSAVILGPGPKWTRIQNRDLIAGGGHSGPGPKMDAGFTTTCSFAVGAKLFDEAA